MQVKLLTYGCYGIGKTAIFKTGINDPRIFPLLLLNFEGGTMSINSVINELKPIIDFIRAAKEAGKPKGAYKEDYENYVNSEKNSRLDKVDVLKVTCWDDLEDIIDLLDSGKTRYKSLGVDSLTEINYLGLREITEKAGKTNPAKHDGELSQLQDYARSATRMRRVIRSFRDLPINVFFTALPVENKDETSGAIEIRPSLTGKLSEEIPGMLDVVGYMSTHKLKSGESEADSKRVIYFQPQGRFRAKDRSEGGKLGLYMELDKDTKTLVEIFDKLEIPMPVDTSKDFIAVSS